MAWEEGEEIVIISGELCPDSLSSVEKESGEKCKYMTCCDAHYHFLASSELRVHLAYPRQMGSSLITG